MVLEGLGRFWEHTKGKLILYIPADVHKDSQFPFKAGDKVVVSIKDGSLVVEKEK